MYKGKHANHKELGKKCGTKCKTSVLLVSLVIILALAIGTASAFLIAADVPIANIFKSSSVSSSVCEEKFENDVKENVYITNTGDIEAYIRAAIVVTWKDSSGNVYGGAPAAGTDYTIELNLTDWIDGKDGFYYYKNPVAPGDSTNPLIVKCFPTDANTPAGYGLNAEILGSAIQSVPVSAVNEKWPAVTVVTPHGDLTKVS